MLDLSRLPRPLLGMRLALDLRGTFHLFEAPLVDAAIDVHLAFSFDGVTSSVLRREGRVSGRIDAEGLAVGRRVTYREAGEMQAIVTITFASDAPSFAGEELTLRGFVEVLPVAPVATSTTMPFSLYSARDAEIGRGVLRFDLRGDLLSALASVRPSLGFGARRKIDDGEGT
jgi:hypothetical protein